MLAAESKRMELTYGQATFGCHGHYAADPEAIVRITAAQVTLDRVRASRSEAARRLMRAGRDRSMVITPAFSSRAATQPAVARRSTA
jgi:hypothetical protein